MAGMYGCFKGRNSDGAAMASGPPDPMSSQEPAEIQEDCAGKKKSKFQTFKKFFARKKRKEPTTVGAESGLKGSQSSDNVSKTPENNTLTRSEKEKGSGSKISLGSKALSHDSVFVSDSSEANEALGASQDSIHGKVKSLQLQLKQAIRLGSPPSLMCVKRTEDAGTMSEDDGLPCSPPEYTALHTAMNQAQRNSSISLEGIDSDDDQLSCAASSRAVSPLVVPGDFSQPASPFACLDNSAAKHKMGLRHKACNRRKPGRRLEGKTEGDSGMEEMLTTSIQEAEAPETQQRNEEVNADELKPKVKEEREEEEEEQPQFSRQSLLRDKEEREEGEDESEAEQEVSHGLDSSCPPGWSLSEEEESDLHLLPSSLDSPRATPEPPAGLREHFLDLSDSTRAAEEKTAEEEDVIVQENKVEEESSFLQEVLSSLKTPLVSSSLDVGTQEVILEKKEVEEEEKQDVETEEGEEVEEEDEPVGYQAAPPFSVPSDQTTEEEEEFITAPREEEDKENKKEEEEKEVEAAEEELTYQEDEAEEERFTKHHEDKEEEMEECKPEEENITLTRQTITQPGEEEEEEEEEEEQEQEQEVEEENEGVEEAIELEEQEEVEEEEIKEDDSEEVEVEDGTGVEGKEREEEMTEVQREEAEEHDSLCNMTQESDEDDDDQDDEDEVSADQNWTSMQEEEKYEDQNSGDETQDGPERLEEGKEILLKQENEEPSHLDVDQTEQGLEHQHAEGTSHSDIEEVKKGLSEVVDEAAAVPAKPSSLSFHDSNYEFHSQEDQTSSPSPTSSFQIDLVSPSSEKPSCPLSPADQSVLQAPSDDSTELHVGEEEDAEKEKQSLQDPEALASVSVEETVNQPISRLDPSKARFTIAPAWQRSQSLSPPSSPPACDSPSPSVAKAESPTSPKVEVVLSPTRVRNPGIVTARPYNSATPTSFKTQSSTEAESSVIVEGNPDNPFGVRLRKTSALFRFSSEEENSEPPVESPTQSATCKADSPQPITIKPSVCPPISSKPALPKKPEVHGEGAVKLKRASDPAAARSGSVGSDSPSWISMAKQKQKIYKENSLDEITVKKEEQERKASLPTYVCSAASKEHSYQTVSPVEVVKPSVFVDREATRSLSPPTPVPAQPLTSPTPPATAQRPFSPPAPLPQKSPPCTSPPVTSPPFLRTAPEKPVSRATGPSTAPPAQRGPPPSALPQDEPPWMALAKKKAKAWSEMPQIVQ